MKFKQKIYINQLGSKTTLKKERKLKITSAKLIKKSKPKEIDESINIGIVKCNICCAIFDGI